MVRQYHITPLSELPLHNDFTFSQVMRFKEVCRLFLEALRSGDADMKLEKRKSVHSDQRDSRSRRNQATLPGNGI